jgi:hypothetical protein
MEECQAQFQILRRSPFLSTFHEPRKTMGKHHFPMFSGISKFAGGKKFRRIFGGGLMFSCGLSLGSLEGIHRLGYFGGFLAHNVRGQVAFAT